MNADELAALGAKLKEIANQKKQDILMGYDIGLLTKEEMEAKFDKVNDILTQAIDCYRQANHIKYNES